MIDIGKIFKPRNMRRVLLLALLFSPLVYLFGTQFTALQGAHGEEVLAVANDEPDLNVEIDGITYKRFVYSDSMKYWHYTNHSSFEYQYLYLYPDFYVTFDDSYLGTLDSNLNFGSMHFVSCFGIFDGQTFYCEESENVYLSFYFGSSSMVCCLEVWSSYEVGRHYRMIEYDLADTEPYIIGEGGPSYTLVFTDFDTYPNWIDFGAQEFNNPYVRAHVVEFDSLRKVPRIAPRKQSSSVAQYSDGLFGNFFNPNNWVSKLGKQVMQDEAIGFAPVGELMRFADDNMLHIKDTPWGDLAYGYGYYAINVFLLYEVVCLSMFVIALPFKIIDILEKKTGGDL